MQISPEKEKKSLKTKKRQYDDYIRYSNIALQMAVIIAAGVFGGVKLDEIIHIKFPLFTLVFSMLSVGIAIYISIRDFIKK
jgi:ATP synthase protein I